MSHSTVTVLKLIQYCIRYSSHFCEELQYDYDHTTPISKFTYSDLQRVCRGMRKNKHEMSLNAPRADLLSFIERIYMESLLEHASGQRVIILDPQHHRILTKTNTALVMTPYEDRDKIDNTHIFTLSYVDHRPVIQGLPQVMQYYDNKISFWVDQKNNMALDDYFRGQVNASGLLTSHTVQSNGLPKPNQIFEVVMLEAAEHKLGPAYGSTTAPYHTEHIEPFVLTTYNILTSHPTNEYKRSVYERELEGATCWAERKNLIISQLVHSDIIVLNECTRLQLASILEGTSTEIGHGQLKTHNFDGTFILYNPLQFRLRDTFSTTIDQRYSQVVVAVQLYHLSTHITMTVVGLHLKSGYAEAEQIRQRQFNHALQKVKRQWPDSIHTPMIVAGDLNSDYTAGYSSLVQHGIQGLEYKLRNAAGDHGTLVTSPTYNHWHRSTFDYILLSPTLLSTTMFVEENHGRSPNARNGADHFAVTSELTFMS